MYNKEDLRGKLRDYKDQYHRFNYSYWSNQVENLAEDDTHSIEQMYKILTKIEKTLKSV